MMWARLVVLVGAACSPYGGGAFMCADDGQCSSAADEIAGRCEPSGYCSLVDPGCASGWRFAESAGAGLAGACVEAAQIDAPVDLGDGRVADAAPADALPLCAPQAGLIACYAFEGDLLDGSGSGNHASPSTETYVAGVEGTALHSIATTESIIAESPTLDVARLTMEAGIRADELPAVGLRAGLFDNNGQYGLFLLPGGDVLCTGGGSQLAVTGVVALATWTHLACTYDGSTRILYVNGIATSTLAGGGALAQDANDGSALAGNSPSGEPFLGDLDNLRLWSQARLPIDICRAAGCE